MMKVQRTKPSRISGLYAITPDMTDTDRLCELVAASLKGGAAIIQYRNKAANAKLRSEQASALAYLCREHDVPLIINDHLDLCMAIDADGVHLGSDDGNLAEVRVKLGKDKLLGASCYNRFELGKQAKIQGADYVAFGACFDSGTKPAAAHAPLELIKRAKTELDLPIVAIGGITLDNAKFALEAGADAVAVIGALYHPEDIENTARQFLRLYQPQT